MLVVAAIKEMFEDIKRANADKELNRTKVLVLDPVTGNFTLRNGLKFKWEMLSKY